MFQLLGLVCLGTALVSAGYDFFVRPPQFFLLGFWPSTAIIYSVIFCLTSLLFFAVDIWGPDKVGEVLVNVLTSPLTWNLLGGAVIVGMFATVLRYFEVMAAAQSLNELNYLWNQLVVCFVLAVLCEAGGLFGWYTRPNSRYSRYS